MQRSETNQTCVMDEDEIERTLVRMAHQILEQNKGCENLALVGILTRGDILARKLADIIYNIEGVHVPVGSLDISFYRDDASISGLPQLHGTDLCSTLTTRPSCWWTMCSSPDVRSEPRSTRSWISGAQRVSSLPSWVDRGHRELPIRADFVGKNIPSSLNENVRLRLKDIDGYSCVTISPIEPGKRIGSAPVGGE